MTNDLEQTNKALDVVDPMANVVNPAANEVASQVDSTVGTANPTPELINTQGNAKPVFDPNAVAVGNKIYGSNTDKDLSFNNNNTK